MGTLTLLRSMSMFFVISAFPIAISLCWVRFEGFRPPKVGEFANHWKKLLIWHGERCKRWRLQLTLLTLSTVGWLLLARRFGTSCHVVPSKLSSNQDFLCGCTYIIFQHWVFVRVPEQVVHSYGRFFGEWFKKWCARAYALKNLEDNVHDVGFYLQYSLIKSFHEFP